MKKVIGLLLLGALSSISFGENLDGFDKNSFNLRVGGDISTKVSSVGKYSESSTEDYGYEVGLEYMRNLTPKFSLGLGLAYQEHSKINGKKQEREYINGAIETDYSKGFEDFKGYNSVPVYLTGKYILTDKWSIKPYIKGNIGYSFNFGNEDIHYNDGYSSENENTDQVVGGETFEAYSLSTKVDNGLYYGAGIGFEYKSFSGEIMYQVNEGKLSVTDKTSSINEKYDLNYKRVSAILTYKF